MSSPQRTEYGQWEKKRILRRRMKYGNVYRRHVLPRKSDFRFSVWIRIRKIQKVTRVTWLKWERPRLEFEIGNYGGSGFWLDHKSLSEHELYMSLRVHVRVVAILRRWIRLSVEKVFFMLVSTQAHSSIHCASNRVSGEFHNRSICEGTKAHKQEATSLANDSPCSIDRRNSLRGRWPWVCVVK